MDRENFWKRHWTFVLYMIFGLAATLLETSLYYLFYEKSGMPNLQATLIAWFLTVVFAFFTNKAFVYRSMNWHLGRVVKEFCFFLGFRAGTGIFNLLYMYVTVDILNWKPVLMKLISALIVGLMNYIFGKAIIFKKGASQSQKSQDQALNG